jgi:hypothetical protein
MATYAAIFAPGGNPSGGGAQDTQKVTALAITTASSVLTIGVRNKIVVVVVANPGATAGAATNGANIRFSLAGSGGSSTASTADFMIPLNSAFTFDMSDAFNQVSFFNNNTATGGTVDIYVMRLAN